MTEITCALRWFDADAFASCSPLQKHAFAAVAPPFARVRSEHGVLGGQKTSHPLRVFCATKELRFRSCVARLE